MIKAYAVVTVLAISFVSNAAAVAQCNKTIIALLRKIPECYTNGKPPKLRALNDWGTHVLISKGELPDNTRCVTAIQRPNGADVNIYLKNGRNISYFANQMSRNCEYLEESGPPFPKGAKYHLYVIHNECDVRVYSYYRCTKGPIGSTGTPMVDVAVACSHVNNPRSRAVVERAIKCFRALGINNFVDLPPCQC